MRTTSTIAPFALLALCSGCASTLNKDRQSIVINTSPQGAAVYENGAEVGATPYTYRYDRSDGKVVTLDLRKDGLEGRSLQLSPRTAHTPLLVDALLLNIPYYLSDSKSNALYYFPRKELVLNMYKSLPKDATPIDLPVVTMTNATGKRSFGHMGTKALNMESRVLSDLDYPDVFTSSLIGSMHQGNLETHTVRLGSDKAEEALRKAKFYLKPVLQDLDIQLSEQEKRVYGEVGMDMHWEFHSGLNKDSILFTVDRHTTFPVYDMNASEVLSEAAKDAGRRLLEEEGLEDRLRKAFNAGMQLSKGTALVLPRPVPVAFKGRKDMLSELVKAVVTIETTEGHGSGFLVTNDGYIITNAHVVGDANSVKVRFQQGFTLDGTVAKINRDMDVALIKTPGNDLPALAIGDDAGLQLGEELFAIGTPLDEQLGQSVTRGIMSGRRELDGRAFIQTDVSINPGNSGGPLIDENGKVVGVATLKIKEEGVQGLGFGVPISTALEMLNLSFR